LAERGRPGRRNGILNKTSTTRAIRNKHPFHHASLELGSGRIALLPAV
jgi:hypothetical protein